MKITENTVLSDILKIPEAEKIMSKYDLPCLTCPMAKFETEKLKIGDICKTYGIDTVKLIKDLNDFLQK